MLPTVTTTPELSPLRYLYFPVCSGSRLPPKRRASAEPGTHSLRKRTQTKTVTLTGTLHSPEGAETINEKLADQRAKAIEKILPGSVEKFDYKNAADPIEFVRTKAIVQDWTMFADIWRSLLYKPRSRKTRFQSRGGYGSETR